MKILWLGNIILPLIAEKENLERVFVGGWMVSLSERFKELENHSLCYVFDSKFAVSGKTDYYSYYGVPGNKNSSKKLGKSYVNNLAEILEQEQPDVIHIWGTESPHSLAMVEASELVKLNPRVVISIQGLVSIYANHYNAYLPDNIVNGYTIKDFIQGNMKYRQRVFRSKGELEVEALKRAKYVIGRTEWDKAAVWAINPKMKYFFNNETLRTEFYDDEWNIKNCKKFSIFCSQAHYPIKGLHLIIEALSIIKNEYPNVHLFIGGKNYKEINYIKQNKYERYINNLIDKNNLKDMITFTGFLDAEKMKQRYLLANVFVSPSSIENSPNSVGEAMLLGVPVVSSRVGGVHNMLSDKVDGVLYPADEPYMLAYYISELFGNIKLSEFYSKNAREHSRKTHDREVNFKQLLNIYNNIKDDNVLEKSIYDEI